MIFINGIFLLFYQGRQKKSRSAVPEKNCLNIAGGLSGETMSGRCIFEGAGFFLRALLAITLALYLAPTVYAHYGLAGMLPGDAVDPLPV